MAATLKKFQCGFKHFGKVNADDGVIEGVSLITVGEAKGHGLYIDATTLQQVHEAANKYANGVRVNADHYSGILACVGFVDKFRIEGEKLLADLHLLKTHPGYAQLLEMAERISDTFGISLSFSGADEEINKVYYARCAEVYSADIVCVPAANPTGLFEAKVDNLNKGMADDENNFKKLLNEELSALGKKLEDHITTSFGNHGTALEGHFTKLGEKLSKVFKMDDDDADGEDDEELDDEGSEDGNKAHSAKVAIKKLKKQFSADLAALKDDLLKSFTAAGGTGTVIPPSAPVNTPAAPAAPTEKKYETLFREAYALHKQSVKDGKVNSLSAADEWAGTVDKLQKDNRKAFEDFLARRDGKLPGGIEKLTD